MNPIKMLATRIWCVLRDNHDFDERTLLRWCRKCGMVEIKEGERWGVFHDCYDDSWMTPTQEKTISEELFAYLDYAESKGWK